jgi:NAD(P)-dependent dehydrogenase (short-subunit alcohol dehydrogenase family)
VAPEVRAGRLDGKTAVVVGAGQTAGETIGNGRATALLFAREGARLLLVDRDEASVTATRDEILGEGGTAEIHLADVNDEQACVDLVARAVSTLGRIDVLHNNVGIGAGDGRPVDVDARAWDRILDVNLKAMWLTCKHVVPVMRDQGGGAIVNISSLAAVAAASTLTAYKISKAGVNALTQTLAVAHAADGIRVNAIMPGLIDTPMAVDAAARATGRPREQLAAARARHVPLGHQGSAWDVAHAALFLASDDAAFITGVALAVDGGQAAMVG